MREHRAPACPLCDLDSLEGLRQGTDLVDLDEQRIRNTPFDPIAQAARIGHEHIVADKLNRAAELMREKAPAVPIVLGHAIFDRDDRISANEIGPVSDEAGSIERLALAGEAIGAVAVEFAR